MATEHFRYRPCILSPADVMATNREWRTRGLSPMPFPARALRRLQEAGDDMPFDEADALIDHRDERVMMAAVERHGHRLSVIRWETLASLHVQRAAVKRLVWTWALDRLWLQARLHAPATLEEYRWNSILTAQALDDSGPRTIELALEAFQSEPVTVPIARRSSHVTALRRHCVERSECWAALLLNWHWDTPELAQLVADSAWRAISRIGAERLSAGEGLTVPGEGSRPDDGRLRLDRLVLARALHAIEVADDRLETRRAEDLSAALLLGGSTTRERAVALMARLGG